MKKIRKSVWMLFFVLMMCSVAACGRSNTNNAGQGTTTGQTSGAGNGTGANDTGTNGTTGTTGTAGAGETAGTSGGVNGMENGNGAVTEESSTGVINGLIDDVERGVNDLTGTETTGAAGTETTGAAR